MREFTVVVWMVLIGTAGAQQERGRMPPVPPRLATIGSIDHAGGTLELRTYSVRFVTELRNKSIEKDGESRQIQYSVLKPVYEERVETVGLKVADVYDATGNKLSPEEFAKRAEVDAAVAVSADGEMVADVYRKALAKDTLIIVAPPGGKAAEK